MSLTSPQNDLRQPRSPRYDSLDLWRGVACLAVVAFHATVFSNETHPSRDLPGILVALTNRGWMGVPIFFVISGYCITATIDSARRKPRGTGQYFLRRFRRIFPPFWIWLAFSVIFWLVFQQIGMGRVITGTFGTVPMVPHLGRITLGQWLGNITLTEMWRPNLDGIPGSMILGQTWTLCYEAQFYAVAGLILWLAPRHYFKAAALVTLAVIACGPLQLDTRGFFWDGRWVLFAVGIGVYHALNYGARREKMATLGLLAAGLAYSVARRLDIVPQAFAYPILHRSEALAGFIFAVFMLLMQPLDEKVCTWWPMRPLVYCGKICYSIYLVHLPLVFALAHGLYIAGARTALPTVLVTLPASLALSIGVGAAFHVLVERRFINAPGAYKVPVEAPAPDVSA